MEKLANSIVFEKQKTVLDFLIETKEQKEENINYCKLKINCKKFLDNLSGNQLSWYDYLEKYVSEANINPEQNNMVRACWELMNKIY